MSHRWNASFISMSEPCPQRKSPRLATFDYGLPGDYFVTIGAFQKKLVFGVVKDGEVRLSDLGRLAAEEWVITLARRPYMWCDAWVVMPNHVHILLGFDQQIQRVSLASIIGGYKSAVTRSARREGLWGAYPLWQRSYHDRIVRNEREYTLIHEYILDNPRRWEDDRLNPDV